jgi:hypothetical protein
MLVLKVSSRTTSNASVIGVMKNSPVMRCGSVAVTTPS